MEQLFAFSFLLLQSSEVLNFLGVERGMQGGSFICRFLCKLWREICGLFSCTSIPLIRVIRFTILAVVASWIVIVVYRVRFFLEGHGGGHGFLMGRGQMGWIGFIVRPAALRVLELF